jgi:hypothetical protein
MTAVMPNFQVLESQLSEVEIALLAAVNLCLDACLLAGSRPVLTIKHLEQHAANFEASNQRKAAEMMRALAYLHSHASAGLR